MNIIPIKEKINYKNEIVAGVSTFLTMSYVFLLNPILLSKTGIDLSAAFFATTIASFIATLAMGLYAKLPFAVAPAPSITTFFVSYVCLKLGLSWEAALAAVVLSGLFSVVMTKLSIRGKLIESISFPLKIGVLFAISGFLIANGLVQGKIISYSSGVLDIAKFKIDNLISPTAIILYIGFFVTWIFKTKWLKFSGAPILGILVATIFASFYGIISFTKAEISSEMTSATFSADFSLLFDSRFLLAMLMIFIIDFFGGVGKYVGLFTAMGSKSKEIEQKNLNKALYVDGWANVVGGFLGASSLAVFVSSAVGIKSGGKTGFTSVVTAILILFSFFLIPLMGSIPVEATSGVLIYVGLILIPYEEIKSGHNEFKFFDFLISIVAAIISIYTYGIDKAILLVFLVYSLRIILKAKDIKNNFILIISTILLLLAVLFQYYIDSGN